MTIRRGEGWGEAVERPPDLLVVASDAALAAAAARRAGVPLAVSGGDLFRSLGSPGERRTVQRLPMDLLRVALDDRELVAAAHVVARRTWWRGALVAVMNGDHLGPWNVAPRAHPNDGRFDVVEVDRAMSIRDRLQARRRLPQGTHLPHPRISTRAAQSASWHFEPPMRVWVDGLRRGSARHLSVTIEPDAYELHV